jgi:hypothetical protein
MALGKTISSGATYVVNNGSTTTATQYACEAVVFNGVLQPDIRVQYPGVFTAGTATNPSASASQTDSNG